ncbi:MAG TPA: hypothetical protein VHT74_03640 [Acetobacteraceae bacterium]|nr:hypothetical protein [Acetobacteraceae bacterium]
MAILLNSSARRNFSRFQSTSLHSQESLGLSDLASQPDEAQLVEPDLLSPQPGGLLDPDQHPLFAIPERVGAARGQPQHDGGTRQAALGVVARSEGLGGKVQNLLHFHAQRRVGSLQRPSGGTM